MTMALSLMDGEHRSSTMTARSVCLSLSALVLSVGCMSARAFGQTVRLHVDVVNGEDDPASPPGQSWEDAFKYLQDALDRAAFLLAQQTPPTAVHIWVAAGTYYPDEGDTPTAGEERWAFALRNQVQIYGGFTNGDDAFADRDPNPLTNGTILSGNIGNAGSATDNSWTVVTAGPAERNVSMRMRRAWS
jgi:hypothetical protein